MSTISLDSIIIYKEDPYFNNLLRGCELVLLSLKDCNNMIESATLEIECLKDRYPELVSLTNLIFQGYEDTSAIYTKDIELRLNLIDKAIEAPLPYEQLFQKHIRNFNSSSRDKDIECLQLIEILLHNIEKHPQNPIYREFDTDALKKICDPTSFDRWSAILQDAGFTPDNKAQTKINLIPDEESVLGEMLSTDQLHNLINARRCVSQLLDIDKLKVDDNGNIPFDALQCILADQRIPVVLSNKHTRETDPKETLDIPPGCAKRGSKGTSGIEGSSSLRPQKPWE